ncbi:hypothetical protein U1Q18_004697, partial [Sarracenia purpurea var. burkii]
EFSILLLSEQRIWQQNFQNKLEGNSVGALIAWVIPEDSESAEVQPRISGDFELRTVIAQENKPTNNKVESWNFSMENQGTSGLHLIEILIGKGNHLVWQVVAGWIDLVIRGIEIELFR